LSNRHKVLQEGISECRICSETYEKNKKKAMTPESKVQRKIITKLEGAGWYVVRNIITNKGGFPDLTCLKNGDCVLIEVKRKGGKPRPLQVAVHEILRSLGFEVRVVDDVEQIKDML